MLSESIGPLLRAARTEAGLTRAELARRCGISVRLLAELERGERPNVSLETALGLLGAVGVVVRLTTPAGDATEIRSPVTDAIARAARAEHRRRTWTGEITSLHAPARDPEPARTPAARLAAVAEVSQQAYAIARGARRSS